MNFGVAPQSSHAYTLSRAFTIANMYNHIYRVFYSMRYLSLLSITRHIFSLSCIQPCDSVEHHPMVLSLPSNTKRSVDPYHALTPMSCNVLVHMQCNAPLHVISCPMYNECYIDNIIHTTHRVSWTITSPAYDFHNSFYSCQYIMHAYININIQHVILCSSNETHNQAM